MSIGVLESLRKLQDVSLSSRKLHKPAHFIVEIFHKTDHASDDLHSLSLPIDDLSLPLDHIVILLHRFLDYIVIVLKEQINQAVELVHTRDP